MPYNYKEEPMEMLVAICLVAVGLAVGLFGYKLFKVLMPVAGLAVGASIGFTGFQGVFGTGVTATTIAILVAIVFAIVLAILSYAFFDLALIVFMGVAMSALFSLIGLAFGLSANGFVLGLLSLSGFIIGIILASSSVLFTENFVTLVTAYVGTGLALAGIFLLVTGVEIQSMVDNGVITTASKYASQSFWWILIWIASFLIMRQVQLRMLVLDIFREDFAYKPSK